MVGTSSAIETDRVTGDASSLGRITASALYTKRAGGFEGLSIRKTLGLPNGIYPCKMLSTESIHYSTHPLRRRLTHPSSIA